MGDSVWTFWSLLVLVFTFQSVSMTYVSFGDFNPTLIRPLNSSHPYCSYFQNRMPQPAPELHNCSWYRKESCCRQAELDAIFKTIKPVLGADEECEKMLTYMICWICDPTQNSFYSSSKQKLTFCESLCDKILNACGKAIFKGEEMGESYKTGRSFCLDHNFNVSSHPEERCFSYKTAFGSAGNDANRGKLSMPGIIFLLLVCSHYFVF